MFPIVLDHCLYPDQTSIVVVPLLEKHCWDIYRSKSQKHKNKFLYELARQINNDCKYGYLSSLATEQETINMFFTVNELTGEVANEKYKSFQIENVHNHVSNKDQLLISNQRLVIHAALNHLMEDIHKAHPEISLAECLYRNAGHKDRHGWPIPFDEQLIKPVYRPYYDRAIKIIDRLPSMATERINDIVNLLTE